MGHFFYKSDEAIEQEFDYLLSNNAVDVLILLGINSYYNYKCSYGKKSDKYLVVTDYYINHCLEEELVELFYQKNVLIYEDSITRPYNTKTLYYYQDICKKYQAKKINLCAYSKECHLDFGDNDVEVSILLSKKDIDSFLYWQTAHYCYNMNSPEIGSVSYYAKIPYMLFISLKEKLAFYNEPSNDSISCKRGHFNFTVLLPLKEKYLSAIKYKYQIDETNQTVDIVFTPVTMLLPTFDKNEEIIEDFNKLYKHTQYQLDVLEKYQEKFSSNILEIILRANENAINILTGIKFQKYMSKHFKIELNCDTSFLVENVNKKLRSCLEQLIHSSSMNAEKEYNTDSMDFILGDGKSNSTVEKMQSKLNMELSKEILEHQVCLFQTLEEYLEEKYPYFREIERKRVILSAMIRYSNVNMIENYFAMDDHHINNGMKEGKNCKVLLLK